jgi:hypothetical protein
MEKERTMNFSRIGALCAFAAALTLQGCFSATMTPSYQPEAPARSIVGDKKPKLFVGKLEDKNDFSTPIVLYTTGKLKTPLADGLREALTTETRRLGFETAVDERSADAALTGVVRTAKMQYGSPGVVLTKLALELKLIDKSGREIWTGDIKGDGDNEDDTRTTPTKAFNASLNGAIAQAMAALGPLWESEKVVSLIFPSGKVKAEPAVAAAPETPEKIVASDIDELPAARAAENPKAHAVVIGIRRYRQKLPEADFADSDARLVTKYLTQALGYQKASVATLVNDQAQKSDFEKYFDQWLPNRVEKGDDVFVFYSGHGAPNPTTGDAYLVPWDGDPTYLKETAFPLKRMYAALAKLPARRITVVMDSCFSGAGGRSVLAKGAKPLVNRVDETPVPGNISVLTASDGNQVTYAYDEKGHGLFTYFFLKGLQQGLGKNGADMKAVFDFAAPQVSRIARREYNNDQAPQWRAGGQ